MGREDAFFIGTVASAWLAFMASTLSVSFGEFYLNVHQPLFEQDWAFDDKDGNGIFDFPSEITPKVENPILVSDFSNLEKPFAEWDAAEFHVALDITSRGLYGLGALLWLGFLGVTLHSPEMDKFIAKLQAKNAKKA